MYGTVKASLEIGIMFLLAILLLGVSIYAAPQVRHQHCHNPLFVVENSNSPIAISCVQLLTFDPLPTRATVATEVTVATAAIVATNAIIRTKKSAKPSM